MSKTQQFDGELPEGVSLRFTEAGIPVMRIHYSADPERRKVEWKERERRKYSSQAAWDREQEIVHEAGGGELLFRHILDRWRDKILILDPRWRPSPHWRRIGGFDYGGTNPTVVELGYIDQDGVIYIASEYYWAPSGEESKRSVHAHAEQMVTLPGYSFTRDIFADPSIFHRTHHQSNGEFKAISDLFVESGIQNLTPAPDNAEISGMERILEHWRDLDHRESTLKIFCPSNLDYEKKHYGTYQWGCPNLVWELRRARREVLSAVQLLRQNPTEGIVDKDNHARDCLKYLVLSMPRPAKIGLEQKFAEVQKRVEDGSQSKTNAMIHRKRLEAEARHIVRPAFYSSRAAMRARKWLQKPKNGRNYADWRNPGA